MTRRVVVTGIGLVTPLGTGTQTSWSGIVEGKSGIRRISYFDAEATGMACTIAGEVPDFDIENYVNRKDARKMDTFIHYGIAAATMALEQSGLEITEANAERVGVMIGSGIGGMPAIERTMRAYEAGGARKISPFFIPMTIINMASGWVSMLTGAKGPNSATVTACATATHAIGDAFEIIARGDADAMIAGGTEACVCELAVGGFSAARALSTRNDEPTKASRPWDKDRDGFVMGEGAGVLMLESLDSAKARGAVILAEVVGYGMSGDAYHMTSPAPEGEGGARCMKMALATAGINTDEVDYINAHGTSTPAGDICETQGIKSVFGEHAKKLMVSSTKSMTGHLLGAAGGIEAAFSVLALHHGVVPPTINLDNPDEGCDLDYVPHHAREADIRVAISNSFGFGGTNASLVLRKFV
ncbi:MAG: beta-ketoacyl-[acyl-carrier-protein] synthase II [Zetaproteobacteria bacterium CG12_big_fil_rev_8_21_14_0_65_55_1124]|nr:MAG: beta-ketoacyl-[acyl-carrier-protein] synthase II [Zetaproteobacteria bacterium CG1_02_55_237]PIS19867.1 MAG: beta-ketoacyl-[acyl-carrier-protein] synthase II [Zetaproteobacteria bacterium CG08_land_8_20_14_0_20_55_17]PIW42531.1 MAG: beta-ketoacyl-[acyl-carrier-protein] synthase II [Zetaproteobacteria bacterium CG12_big_fil_rev_8_21_14_0_65_55_1124]PIY51320.1 MAG: beta-ketoacyl-[acyl-carrier-protein] synthase II [Zetaproteobacteria bacterium CG_4_10_14_0_8_um_filter_55_43]PIZ36675.1 MAG: